MSEFIDNLTDAMDACCGSRETRERNDRSRAYDGQPHTDLGFRGKTMVEGLTMRDVRDCIVQGFLAASANTKLQKKTCETDKEFIDTEYACNNTWVDNDVYELNCDFDPIAVVQNAMCFIEHYMGIFPNLKIEEQDHD